jgi:hypothetical protein
MLWQKSTSPPSHHIEGIRWREHPKTSGVVQTDGYMLNIGTRTWAWLFIPPECCSLVI